MESYRRQELPVTLEPVEQDVPYRAFTKSNTIMENVEWLLFRISSEEPEGIFKNTMQRWHRQKVGFCIFGQDTLQEYQEKIPHI